MKKFISFLLSSFFQNSLNCLDTSDALMPRWNFTSGNRYSHNDVILIPVAVRS